MMPKAHVTLAATLTGAGALASTYCDALTKGSRGAWDPQPENQARLLRAHLA